MNKITALAIAFPLALIAMAAAIILEGFVIYILWGWFAVPIFELRSLTIVQAIALSLMVGLLTNQYYATPDGKTWERFGFMFFHPLAVLAVGWIVKFWI